MKLEITYYLIGYVYSDTETRFHRSLSIGSDVGWWWGTNTTGQAGECNDVIRLSFVVK